MSGHRSFELYKPHDACDAKIYEVATKEPGDGAFVVPPPRRTDEEPEPKRIRPAWMLRNMLEDKWIADKDPVAMVEGMSIEILSQIIKSSNKSRLPIGAAVEFTCKWQGWSRKAPNDMTTGHFEDATASALEAM